MHVGNIESTKYKMTHCINIIKKIPLNIGCFKEIVYSWKKRFDLVYLQYFVDLYDIQFLENVIVKVDIAVYKLC